MCFGRVYARRGGNAAAYLQNPAAGFWRPRLVRERGESAMATKPSYGTMLERPRAGRSAPRPHRLDETVASGAHAGSVPIEPLGARIHVVVREGQLSGDVREAQACGLDNGVKSTDAKTPSPALPHDLSEIPWGQNEGGRGEYRGVKGGLGGLKMPSTVITRRSGRPNGTSPRQSIRTSSTSPWGGRMRSGRRAICPGKMGG
jgi:hypothetical protein